MARRYAIDGLPGIAGGVITHVGGGVVRAGDPLPAGTSEFDITYWHKPTPADIAAGATPGERINVTIQNIPISASNADVRNAILQARAAVRGSGGFKYPPAFAWVT